MGLLGLSTHLKQNMSLPNPNLLLPSFLLTFFLSLLLPSADHPPLLLLLLPLSKNPTSLHYLFNHYFHPGQRPFDLVLDLDGHSTSILCSSQGIARRLHCRSLPCLSARVIVDGAADDHTNVFCWDGGSACGVRGVGELVAGDAAFGSSSAFQIPNFLYGCTADRMLSGMPSSVKGFLGLGRSSRISLPFQVAASFGTTTRFSLCLSSSRGVLIIGSGDRSNSLSYTAISKTLAYAPLVTASSEGSPHNYRINLSSIDIDGVPLSPNATSPPYLARLSTMVPYTTMPTPLYKAFSVAFLDAVTSSGMKAAKAIKPFELCFELSGEGWGDHTPAIDLVLQSAMVRWTICRRNLMVRADDRVVCLGIVDGGVGRENEVVIGGHQLEDVFMEFDFGRSMLGFSPSLVSMGTSCEDLAWDLSSNDLS